MRVTKRVLLIFLLVFALICVFTLKVKASEDILNPEDYKTTVKYDEGEFLFEKGAKILTILRAISVIVAVLSISILGIKYMVGSLEEQAQYKEKMLPIAIGAILIGSISSILISINNIMNS